MVSIYSLDIDTVVTWLATTPISLMIFHKLAGAHNAPKHPTSHMFRQVKITTGGLFLGLHWDTASKRAFDSWCQISISMMQTGTDRSSTLLLCFASIAALRRQGLTGLCRRTDMVELLNWMAHAGLEETHGEAFKTWLSLGQYETDS